LSIVAKFRYREDAGRFEFDSALLGDARLSEQEFRELAGIDEAGPSNERLIELAFAGLKDLIARRTDAETRERFKFMLARCKDTPVVQELKLLLLPE
jgi:hypothetical protein